MIWAYIEDDGENFIQDFDVDFGYDEYNVSMDIMLIVIRILRSFFPSQFFADGDFDLEIGVLTSEQKKIIGQIITGSIKTYAKTVIKRSGILNYISSKCFV